MNHTSHKWYFLSLLLVMTLCFWYVKQRNLEQRVQGHWESQEAVQALQVQVDALKNDVERGRQRVEDLASDPLEQEAAIRRWSGKLREDETVYHVELTPAPDVQAPAPLPSSEYGTPEPN